MLTSQKSLFQRSCCSSVRLNEDSYLCVTFSNASLTDDGVPVHRYSFRNKAAKAEGQ